MGQSSLEIRAAESALRNRISTLQTELTSAQEALERLTRGGHEEAKDTVTRAARDDQEDNGSKIKIRRLVDNRQAPPLVPPSKRGYLYRWVDRSIGWTGTKWALRFVSLENGKIAYYGVHTDDSPRYVLSLRGCAVRDEGYKPNRRHPAFRRKEAGSPPLSRNRGLTFLYFQSSFVKMNRHLDKTHYKRNQQRLFHFYDFRRNR